MHLRRGRFFICLRYITLIIINGRISRHGETDKAGLMRDAAAEISAELAQRAQRLH